MAPALALAPSAAALAQTRPLYNVKAVPATASDYTVIYPLTGAIAARVQSDIAFRTSGRIASRRVEIGAATLLTLLFLPALYVAWHRAKAPAS